MLRVQIPRTIKGQALLPFLAQMSSAADATQVELDFTLLRRVTPAGLVAIVANVDRWRREGRSIRFLGLDQCPVLPYLQRMNVLKMCGVDLPERFRRHESKGRFVSRTPIDHPVERMGEAMAGCIAPGGEDYEHDLAGLYDFSFYVLTEIGNNVRQHSAGTGFASAQVQRQEGLVRLAIADNGMGILGSFRNVGASWSEHADDLTAISKALEPRVSCKFGDPNQGVGLTLVSELAHLAGAWLLIVSGRGALRLNPGQAPVVADLANGGSFRGTLLTMVFPQKPAADFVSLLQQAKLRAGLLRAGRATGRFQP